MKNHISGILLAALMIVLLLPAAALAVGGTPITAAGGTLTDGDYYLDSDVELTDNLTVPNGVEVTLDLNGHVLKGSGSGSVIRVMHYAVLTLQDSDPAAVHTGNFSALPAGGVITGGNRLYGGGIYNDGTVTMNGGTITGNTASQYGGGIYNKGVVTMNGGSITGNTATIYGGGICNEGVVTMNGGSITGNTSQTGGGVYALGGTFEMYGGSITGNTASQYGGGVNMLSGKVIVGNKAYVRGNKTNTIEESNIHLNNNRKDMLTVSSAKPLTEGADIGVTVWLSTGWEIGTEVGSYLGGTMTDSNFQYFVMNNSGSFNQGTVFTVVPDSSDQYVLGILGTVATPVASPAAGTYTGAQTVTLSTDTDGAVIYYTTDGTAPTENSAKYTAPITVAANMTIKAVAVKACWDASDVLEAAYTIIRTVATPVASPAAGTYAEAQTVTLSTDTDGAVIYYTTDGTAPTENSTKYTAPITVDADMTIKAIAVKDNWKTSDVLEAVYTIQPKKIPLEKITVSPQTQILKPGESGAITVLYVPDNTTSAKGFTVTAEPQGVVSVSVLNESTANITALKDGTAVLTVNAADGASATVTVTVKTDPVSYEIILGKNQKVPNTASSALFKSNAEFSKFVRVLVDGKTVDPKYYRAEPGSTAITLLKPFISKLSIGPHTLEIVSTDGSAKTIFTIEKKIIPPKTGDPFSFGFWLALGLASVLLLLILRRKAAR